MTEAKEMAQAVKCLPCKEDDLCPVLRAIQSKQRRLGVAGACNPNPEDLERRDSWDAMAK